MNKIFFLIIITSVFSAKSSIKNELAKRWRDNNYSLSSEEEFKRKSEKTQYLLNEDEDGLFSNFVESKNINKKSDKNNLSNNNISTYVIKKDTCNLIGFYNYSMFINKRTLDNTKNLVRLDTFVISKELIRSPIFYGEQIKDIPVKISSLRKECEKILSNLLEPGSFVESFFIQKIKFEKVDLIYKKCLIKEIALSSYFKEFEKNNANDSVDINTSQKLPTLMFEEKCLPFIEAYNSNDINIIFPLWKKIMTKYFLSNTNFNYEYSHREIEIYRKRLNNPQKYFDLLKYDLLTYGLLNCIDTEKDLILNRETFLTDFWHHFNKLFSNVVTDCKREIKENEKLNNKEEDPFNIDNYDNWIKKNAGLKKVKLTTQEKQELRQARMLGPVDIKLNEKKY